MGESLEKRTEMPTLEMQDNQQFIQEKRSSPRSTVNTPSSDSTSSDSGSCKRRGTRVRSQREVFNYMEIASQPQLNSSSYQKQSGKNRKKSSKRTKNADQSISPQGLTQKRGRGRPRKYPEQSIPQAAPSSRKRVRQQKGKSGRNETIILKRGRGRPRKTPLEPSSMDEKNTENRYHLTAVVKKQKKRDPALPPAWLDKTYVGKSISKIESPDFEDSDSTEFSDDYSESTSRSWIYDTQTKVEKPDVPKMDMTLKPWSSSFLDRSRLNNFGVNLRSKKSALDSAYSEINLEDPLSLFDCIGSFSFSAFQADDWMTEVK